jgi:2-polyprenyl-6-methoxyphenol hydroxylase-like FAD-dependent oxidoreductase
MTDDVVIVGAGPAGLMLACELRLAGVRPLVLERLPERTGLSKALAVVGRAVDVLDARGLLDRFTAAGATGAGFAHFALMPLDLSRLDNLDLRGLLIRQADTERILEQRATELGATIRRGVEVTGLRQDEDGVTLDISGEQLRTRFVVGCDGGSSLVRKQAGIGFPGLPPTRLLRLGEVTLPDGPPPFEPFQPVDGKRDPLLATIVIPLGSDGYRIITNEPYPPDLDRDAPMTVEELQASIRRTRGSDLNLGEVRWLSRYTDASRQAEQYRAGRVLLAGDAAHTHLPAGGPGINTALLDAVNLGWKLAGELQGRDLLDTYHSERHPEGERVLLHTRAQAALLTQDQHIGALREVVSQLLQYEPALRHLVNLMYGLDTRYDVDAGTSPLLGRWAPDLKLTTAEGTTRVADLLHDAKGVLLDLTSQGTFAAEADGWADRVTIVRAGCDNAPADALLIRPDGYVAWAAPGAAAPLTAALTRWFGTA